jgi:hypothetical protein
MKTPAERQAAYRQKHLKDVDGTKLRLNTIINHHAKDGLSRLAKRYGVTQAELLERLILDEENRLARTLTDVEAKAYLFGPV